MLKSNVNNIANHDESPPNEDADVLIEHQIDESQYEIVEVLNPGEEISEEYVQVPTDSELLALESGVHNVVVASTEHSLTS